MVSLVNGGTALKFAPRAEVFAQGDKSGAVFYIETGRVQISVVSDQGEEAIIAIFGPGDFFGEGCLTAQPRRLASATAMTAANVIRIDKAAMGRLLNEKPEFSATFTEFLLARNIRVEREIVDQLFNSSEKRLARLLLLLANFNNDGQLRPIAPKVSQEVLASRVGTTRSRINLFIPGPRTYRIQRLHQGAHRAAQRHRPRLGRHLWRRR